MNAVEVKNLSHTYTSYSLISGKTENEVLRDVSFEIPQGKALGLLGISGCGKSTIANILMGLIEKKSGSIKLFGKELELKNLQQKREFYRQIQIVFQDPISSVNPSLSVFEAIAEPLLYLSNLSKKEIEYRVGNLLDIVKLDAKFKNQRASNLSGGQLQRVCLARALAIEPKILILDEALSSLDLSLQVQILELLQKLKNENLSFLFITHDIRLAKIFCDEIVLIENGEIVEKAKPNENFKSQIGIALQNAVLPRHV